MTTRKTQSCLLNGQTADLTYRLGHKPNISLAIRAPPVPYPLAASTDGREKPVETTPQKAIDQIYSSHTLPEVLLDVFEYT